MRPGHVCTRPGCPGIVRAGVCSRCGALRKQRMAAHDEQRGTAAQRGYDANWRRLRASFLAQHPLCVACEAIGRTVVATDVDHIVPRRAGGSDRDENLQPLCHACHSRKTAAGE